MVTVNRNGQLVQIKYADAQNQAEQGVSMQKSNLILVKI